MREIKIIVGLGVFVAVLPYLGFPGYVKDILFSVFGLGLVALGYILHKKTVTGEKNMNTFDNFSENNDFYEHEKNNDKLPN